MQVRGVHHCLFQEQVSSFREFRNDGKIVNSVKGAVPVLHKLSTSEVLRESISAVRRHGMTGITGH